MKTKTEIHYADNANYKYGSTAPLEATKSSVYQTDYEYDDKAQLIKETTKNSNNTLHIKKIVYPYSKLEDPVHKEMERRHIINAPIQETYYLGSKLLRGSKFNYNVFNDNKHILLEAIESISPENKLTQESAYTYNSIGKPIQVETKSGLTNSFLWDFNGRLLRLKIENIKIKDLQPLISQDIINSSRVAQINWMEYKQKIDSKFDKSFTDLFVNLQLKVYHFL